MSNKEATGVMVPGVFRRDLRSPSWSADRKLKKKEKDLFKYTFTKI